MKYSEAKIRIKDLLESKYGDEWSDHYRFEKWPSSFALSKQDDVSKTFKIILWVSEDDPGCFEVCKLGISEKPLADIFMALALTPLEEREEEKKYVVKVVVKVWDRWAVSGFLVKDRNGFLDVLTTNGVDMLAQNYQVAFTKKEIDGLKDTATLNIDWDKAVEEYDGEI